MNKGMHFCKFLFLFAFLHTNLFFAKEKQFRYVHKEKGTQTASVFLGSVKLLAPLFISMRSGLVKITPFVIPTLAIILAAWQRDFLWDLVVNKSCFGFCWRVITCPLRAIGNYVDNKLANETVLIKENVKKLTQDEDNLTKQAADIVGSLKDIGDKQDVINKQMNDFKEQVRNDSDVHNKIQEMQDTINILQGQSATGEEKASAIEQLSKNLNEALQNIEKKNKEQSEKLNELIQSTKKETNSLSDQLHDVQGLIKDFEDQLLNFEAEISNIQNTSDKAHKQVQNLQTTVDAMNNVVDEQKRSADNHFESIKNTITNQFADVSKEVEEHEKLLEKAQNELLSQCSEYSHITNAKIQESVKQLEEIKNLWTMVESDFNQQKNIHGIAHEQYSDKLKNLADALLTIETNFAKHVSSFQENNNDVEKRIGKINDNLKNLKSYLLNFIKDGFSGLHNSIKTVLDSKDKEIFDLKELLKQRSHENVTNAITQKDFAAVVGILLLQSITRTPLLLGENDRRSQQLLRIVPYGYQGALNNELQKNKESSVCFNNC